MPNPKRNESKQDYLKRCTTELIEKEGQKSNQAFAICNETWDESKSAKSLKLSAPIEMELQSDEDKEADKPRPFMITAYTGNIVEKYWEKFFIDVKGIEMKSKFPAFLEHDRRSIVGTGLKKDIDKSFNLLLSGNFSKIGEASKEVQERSAEGFPWQASVGILPLEIKRLHNEKETAKINGQKLTGPLTIWSKSKVREISFVALGADDDTAAISLLEDETNYNIHTNGGFNNMSEKMTICELKEKQPDLFKEVFQAGFDSAPKIQELSEEKIDPGALKAEQTKERERIVTILSEENAPLEARIQAVKEGKTVDQAYKMFFQSAEAERTASLEKYKGSGAPPVKPAGTEKTEKGKKVDFDAQAMEYQKTHPDISYCEAAKIVISKNPDAYDAQRNKN